MFLVSSFSAQFWVFFAFERPIPPYSAQCRKIAVTNPGEDMFTHFVVSFSGSGLVNCDVGLESNKQGNKEL